MKSLLIKDTTLSERAQIVREALGADGDCEGIDPLVPNAFVTAELNQGDPARFTYHRVRLISIKMYV